MRVPVTSQLALLVLSLASWKAWTEPIATGRPAVQAAAPAPAAPAARRITVRNAFVGGGPAWVHLCGKRTRIEPMTTDQRDGTRDFEILFTGSSRRCTVRAERQDGDYVAETDAVSLEPGGAATLVLPDHRVGGIGVSIVRRGDSVWVEGLLQRGAAHEAGILPGDWLVTADGERLRSVHEARERLLGPEGSRVRVEVFREATGEWRRLAFDLERRSDVD